MKRELLCFSPMILVWLALLPVPGFAKPISERDRSFARDYVFASCLVKKYPGSALANEADAWATGIVENSRFSAADFLRLNELAQTSDPSVSTRQGIELHLRSCLELINSRKFTNKLLKIIN